METNTKNVKKTGVRSRRYFAGANTKYGFYNLFEQINQKERPAFLYILKGGPGTGKSTLMKKLGRALEAKTDIEYFYCSSDPSSLDGIRFPLINTAIVDGTAPHVCETTMPGIKEKIIDLGVFIGESVQQHQQEITRLLAQKKLFFDQAYLYLKNAANLYECNNLIFSSVYKDATTTAKKTAQKIIKEVGLDQIRKGKTGKRGTMQRLFLSAGTDESLDFSVYNNYESVVCLDCDSFLSHLVLKELAEMTANRGIDIICFCNPLNPDELSGVYLPLGDVLIKNNPETQIKIKEQALAETLRYNNNAIKDARAAARKALTKAKDAHKNIEEFYIPAMNFAAIDDITQELTGKIMTALKLY